MDFTSAQYSTDRDGNNSIIIAVVDGETLNIPLDPDNRHYAAILEWVEAGNTIQEAE